MSIKKYLKEFTFEIKNMFKEFFNKETNKKQRANMWTFLRLISPIFALISSICGFSFVSAIIIGFGGLTDFFDGRSARKHGSSSDFGKRLDQVTDKIFVILSGISASIINPIFIPVILMEASIASVNIYYKKKYPTINDKSAFIGKLKQFPLFSSMFMCFLSNINIYLKANANILVLLTVIMQSITLLHYTKTKYEEAKKIDKEKHFMKNNAINVSETRQGKKIKTLTYQKPQINNKNKAKQKIKKKDRY